MRGRHFTRLDPLNEWVFTFSIDKSKIYSSKDKIADVRSP